MVSTFCWFPSQSAFSPHQKMSTVYQEENRIMFLTCSFNNKTCSLLITRHKIITQTSKTNEKSRLKLCSIIFRISKKTHKKTSEVKRPINHHQTNQRTKNGAPSQSTQKNNSMHQ